MSYCNIIHDYQYEVDWPGEGIWQAKLEEVTDIMGGLEEFPQKNLRDQSFEIEHDGFYLSFSQKLWDVIILPIIFSKVMNRGQIVSYMDLEEKHGPIKQGS